MDEDRCEDEKGGGGLEAPVELAAFGRFGNLDGCLGFLFHRYK